MSILFARFAISAWVGAAILFVVTGVREVISNEVPSEIRDVLVTIRFPAYYFFGFVLVGTAIFCAVLGRKHHFWSVRKYVLFSLLLTGAFLLMLADYFWIYQPLVEMVTPAGKAKPASFRQYHEASKWINMIDVGLCLVASFIINWPKSLNDDANSHSV